MSLINDCSNVAAAEIVKPYINGMSVREINSLYNKLERLSYTELLSYANETNNRRLLTIIDICGEPLQAAMREEIL